MKKIIFISLCFYSLFTYGIQDAKWVNVIGAAYNSTTNVLTNNTYSSWCNARAHSANRLKPNTNGYIEYQIEATNKQMFLGLTASDNSSCYHHIQFSFHQQNSNFKVYESGTQKYTSYGALQVGDIVRVERTGVNVYYKRIRNGITTLMYTSTSPVDPSDELFASARLYNYGSSMSSVKASFDVPIDITANIVHIDLDNNVQGEIDIEVTGPSAPYSYTWSNGVVSQDLNNIAGGEYSVVISDIFNNTRTETFRVDYMVKWDNVSGISIDGVNNILTKTAPFGWTNSGAISYNHLKSGEPGIIGYEVDATDNFRFLGFWDEDIANTGVPENCYQNFDYCMYQRYNQVNIIENGNWIGKYNYITPGDIFYIERDVLNNEIKYWFKDVSTGGEYLLRSVTPSNLDKLYAGVAMTHTGMNISKVRSTFTFSKNTISYAELYPKLNGSYHKVEDDILRFHYVEEYQDLDGNLDYKIYQVGRTTPLTLPSESVVYGNNYYEIDLSTIQLRDYFILEVTNEKKEKQYLRFYHNGLTTTAPCSGCATE